MLDLVLRGAVGVNSRVFIALKLTTASQLRVLVRQALDVVSYWPALANKCLVKTTAYAEALCVPCQRL